MVDIIRNVVGSEYRYTMSNQMGVPVTFDFSSKNIDSLRVRYELTKPFLMKAEMGLYDEGFRSREVLKAWILNAKNESFNPGRDISDLLVSNVDFNFKGIRSPRPWAFPDSEHEGFYQFVHRCLTEFKRAFDRDILDQYKSDDGDDLLSLIRGLVPQGLRVALFCRSLLGNREYGCCTVEYDRWQTIMSSPMTKGYRYSESVRDYLKSKLY